MTTRDKIKPPEGAIVKAQWWDMLKPCELCETSAWHTKSEHDSSIAKAMEKKS